MKPIDPTEVRRRKQIRIALVVLLLLLVARLFVPSASVAKTESLSRLVHDISTHQVKSIEVNDQAQSIIATYLDKKVYVTHYPLGYGAKLIESYGSEVTIKVDPLVGVNYLLSLLQTLIPVLLILGAMAYFLRGGGLLKGQIPGMNANKGAVENIPATRFADVGGVSEVVDELQEVVDYLHDPTRFTAMGATVPKGILLVGPPGTGKTLLAKAVAGEAGVAFFALSGSDFVETFVGMGASRVRGVFKEARKAGKAIVFIDELDAVGRARGGGVSNGATEESDRTLNALLVEMDGFVDSSVIVLGATNRPEVLDSAILRAGRFDRKITVGAPDRKGREQILELLTKDKKLDVDVDLSSLAGRTSSMTGADLAYLVNEAALGAARRDATSISMDDLVSALEVVAIGRARTSMVVSERERRLTAYHEAGHAVASLVLEAADDPVLISIVPRGAAGGVTWMEGEDHNFVSKSRATAQLAVLMAGRAGEMVLVGDDFTSGVASDLREAGKIATAMVTHWAMSELGAHVHLGEGKLSDEERAEVDRLVENALGEARELLATHVELHRAVAEAVLEDDVIDQKRLLSIRDAIVAKGEI